jgi:hypothetical protein
MKDDDPEKRIRELEKELADTTRTPQSPPSYTESAPYTGDATYTSGPTYTGDATYTSGPTYPVGASYPGAPPYGLGVPPPRRSKPYPWFLVLILLAVVVPTAISLVGHFARSTFSPGRPSISRGNGAGTTVSSTGPTAVPQGGELRVGGNMETKTVACNDGQLTLYGYNSDYSVTGHCASLTVGGYNNKVFVDSADTLESTGYGNTVTVSACNKGNLKLSSYGIAFNITGHCASLAITSYDNKVTVDSVDSITVSGYNNIVTYHSGTPKVTDSGYSNNIQQG